MNNFLILMLIIWGAASIKSIFNRDDDDDSFGYAFIFSLVAGFGYFIYLCRKSN